MAKSPKRKKRLPRSLPERPDSEIIERILGKRAKKHLDDLSSEQEDSMNKELTKHLHQWQHDF